jgi:hypothetical protein
LKKEVQKFNESRLVGEAGLSGKSFDFLLDTPASYSRVENVEDQARNEASTASFMASFMNADRFISRLYFLNPVAYAVDSLTS